MKQAPSPGRRWRQALASDQPLVVVGAVNAYSALLAEQCGHRALYLSGAGVANASFGLPDLAITTINDVLVDAERITSRVDLPLLVDIDTGFGGAFNINRSIRALERVGVAAVHIEDQVSQKRCGHRPNKALVSSSEMCDRVKACVDARVDDDFFVIARTDALAGEGLQAALERAMAYVEAGADGVFAEAVTQIEQYQQFKQSCACPILANITEFGKTPLFTRAELAVSGAVDMLLYPLSAFRAMSQAAERVYRALRADQQQQVLDSMQNREQLYQSLDYHSFEQQLDRLYGQGSAG